MADELEWKTRRDRINTKLLAVNPAWEIIKYSDKLDTSKLDRHAVEEYPTGNGPADYALFAKGKFLGIIEAKKVRVGPQNVLEQAKRYSKGAFDGPGRWNGYRVPFLYATNGEIIWFIDVRDTKNISRQISGFHTPDALDGFYGDNTSAGYDWLKKNPIDIERLRKYQKKAIKAIESAMIKRKRAMLVAMATGTGKTFTTVSLIYRLLRAKAVRRVLFLVDRRALAAQAVREFASFNTPTGSKFNNEYEVFSQRFHKDDFGDEKPFDPKVLPNEYLTSPGATHTFVYVSTIQRMTINLLGWENAFFQNQSDPDTEADADRLDIPIHAFDLIIADECHRGYTAKETATWRKVMDYFDAVKVGLTATPAPHTLSLFKEVIYRYTTERAILQGHLVDYDAVKIKSNVRVKGVFLKPGEHVGLIDTETGEETYDELEDERDFPSQEIEQKVTAPESNRKIMKEVAKYAYQHEEETGRFPKTLIFAVNDLPPTSHCDQLVEICKEEFGQGDDFVKKITIFDCFDGTLIEYFKDTTDFKIELPQKEPISLEQVIENIYQNVDRDYFIKVLVKRFRRINRSMSGEARETFAAHIPDGDMGKFAGALPKKLGKDFTGTMKLLRDKGFQKLLIDYPRAKRSFTVAYEQDDDVSSDVMIHVGSGYQKPEDYLESFTKFVEQNADEIAALQVLLKRPRDWRTEVLEDLRQKLTRENFPEKELQKAHKLVHNKALADIISMVKHAVRKEAPLLSAEERVDRALKKAIAGKAFDEEQQKWLGYIREHLVENLTIGVEDFEIMPVFERHGGIGAARKVFQGRLETLVREINFEIAA